MPTVDRKDLVVTSVSTNFSEYGILDKLRLVGTIALNVIALVLPYELQVAFGWIENRPNHGRLINVVPNQIWQQRYFIDGNVNATVFQNKQGTALLLYVAPKMSDEFRKDVADLGVPLRYMIVPDCIHESYAADAKRAYPGVTVLCPATCREQVEQALFVDATIESEWAMLERDFGFRKSFKFDDCCLVGAQRSYQIEKFAQSASSSCTTEEEDEEEEDNSKEERKHNNKNNNNILFVGQCGFANFENTWLLQFLGFSTPSRGRFLRQFWYAFSTNKPKIAPFWYETVSSIPNLELALFVHGSPVDAGVGGTKKRLLDFYV